MTLESAVEEMADLVNTKLTVNEPREVLVIDEGRLPPDLLRRLSEKHEFRTQDVVLLGAGSQRHYYGSKDILKMPTTKAVLHIHPERYPAVKVADVEPDDVHPLMRKLLARAVK